LLRSRNTEQTKRKNANVQMRMAQPAESRASETSCGNDQGCREKEMKRL